MKVIKGDLVKMALEGQFDVIIHGCNCFCTMGSGIAKQIREAFPSAYDSDTKNSSKGDIFKLGGFTASTIRVGNRYVTIVNAYTQYNYGAGQRHTEYSAVILAFQRIKALYGNRRLKFAYPKIGAGLGGGDWNIISQIIDKQLDKEDHTLVEYEP